VKSLSGHARLMDPPARNSMWRLGYPNPINIKDDAVWCGGVRGKFSKFRMKHFLKFFAAMQFSGPEK
jgi:hypothetical protein